MFNKYLTIGAFKFNMLPPVVLKSVLLLVCLDDEAPNKFPFNLVNILLESLYIALFGSTLGTLGSKELPCSALGTLGTKDLSSDLMLLLLRHDGVSCFDAVTP